MFKIDEKMLTDFGSGTLAYAAKQGKGNVFEKMHGFIISGYFNM